MDECVNSCTRRARPEKLLKTSGNKAGNVFVFRCWESVELSSDKALNDPHHVAVSHETEESDHSLGHVPGIFLEQHVFRNFGKIHLILAMVACSFVTAIAAYSYVLGSVEIRLDLVEDMPNVVTPTTTDVQTKSQTPDAQTKSQTTDVQTNLQTPDVTLVDRASVYQQEIELLESRNTLLRLELEQLSEETTALNRELLFKELDNIATSDDVIYKYINVPLGFDAETTRSKSGSSSGSGSGSGSSSGSTASP